MDLDERIRFHEAGHAVSYHLFGFRPTFMRFDFKRPLVEHDRRTTWRLNFGKWSFGPKQFAQFDDLAVATAAGIAAEYKAVPEIPLKELWETAGEGDLKSLTVMGHQASFRSVEKAWHVDRTVMKDEEEVETDPKPYIDLWQQRAQELMDNATVWSAIEALAQEAFFYTDDRKWHMNKFELLNVLAPFKLVQTDYIAQKDT